MPFDALLAIQTTAGVVSIEALGRRIVATGPGYRVIAETCQDLTPDHLAEWRIYATNFTTEPLHLSLTWSWRPSSPALSGPLRIVTTVGPDNLPARSIGRTGGEMHGLRIDGPSDALIYDEVRLILPAGMPPERELICVLAPCHPCDFNGDGVVNGGDMAFLLATWGTVDGISDLNGDGLVDAGDLGIFLAGWGEPPPS